MRRFQLGNGLLLIVLLSMTAWMVFNQAGETVPTALSPYEIALSVSGKRNEPEPKTLPWLVWASQNFHLRLGS